MKILVINTWSSSLKYQLFDMKNNTLVVRWDIGKIWEKWSSFPTFKDAFQSVSETLSTGWHRDIDAIGHRVVHGWEYFKNPVVITDEVIKRIEECSDLAPLHNFVNLEWIRLCEALFPGIPQVAVFDTAFHQTMEPAHYLYPIAYSYYEKYKIRRYGFHGTSHQYVYEKLIERLKDWTIEQLNNKRAEDLRVITCHIGNWVSITAIKNRKVIETSMGMTPLEWLMMWTRSGNIDPAIITYLMTHESKTTEQIDDLLNKQSWLLGISWVSNDMRDIIAWIEGWNAKCSLALNMYINSLIKYIWSYAALLWWVDVIVLTAGVMEHRTMVRSMLLEKLSWMWVKIDNQANQSSLPLEKIVSTSDSQVTVIVIPTNEELMIAKQTFTLIEN
jgi:acetate kinase